MTPKHYVAFYIDNDHARQHPESAHKAACACGWKTTFISQDQARQFADAHVTPYRTNSHE